MIEFLIILVYLIPLIKSIVDVMKGEPLYFLFIGLIPVINWIIFMDDAIS